MQLGPDQKRKVLELARSRGIVDECQACGAQEFAVSDTADPIGGDATEGYTVKVVCESCGAPARMFKVQESDL